MEYREITFPVERWELNSVILETDSYAFELTKLSSPALARAEAIIKTRMADAELTNDFVGGQKAGIQWLALLQEKARRGLCPAPPKLYQEVIEDPIRNAFRPFTFNLGSPDSTCNCPECRRHRERRSYLFVDEAEIEREVLGALEGSIPDAPSNTL